VRLALVEQLERYVRCSVRAAETQVAALEAASWSARRAVTGKALRRSAEMRCVERRSAKMARREKQFAAEIRRAAQPRLAAVEAVR
jgi:hypothetical protein